MALDVCVTFDVDLADYVAGGTRDDELIASVGAALEPLARRGVRATWFVRLDQRLQSEFGAADWVFQRHAGILDGLRRDGHELGWHLHAYKRHGTAWVQNTNGVEVAQEILRLAPLAGVHRLTAIRMGWGFHTNETMRAVAQAGLTVDSSAIPRPLYAWETTRKDWSTTGPAPYRPSAADYRTMGEPSLPILEVPMSVARVAAPGDHGVVLRYLNLAYHPALFRGGLEDWFVSRPGIPLVTITHPYELGASANPHPVLAFNAAALDTNLAAVGELAAQVAGGAAFLTISELAEKARRSHGTIPASA